LEVGDSRSHGLGWPAGVCYRGGTGCGVILGKHKEVESLEDQEMDQKHFRRGGSSNYIRLCQMEYEQWVGDLILNIVRSRSRQDTPHL
jgi:hypothetical protein